MRYIIALLTLALFSNLMMGNNCPDGECSSPSTFHVYAPSGLKLRVEPTTQSEVLTIVPYGDKVTLITMTDTAQQIEWMNGHWAKVNYDGIEGYLFGGFISDLPVPTYDFELTQDDLDVTYPLISWAEHNFDEVKRQDTLVTEGLYRITQHMEQGMTLTRRDTKYDFTVILEMPDTELEEAYNLVKSLLLTKPERVSFERESVFIPDNEGEIYRIKVNVNDPIQIRKMEDGSVKILVTSFHHGCDVF